MIDREAPVQPAGSPGVGRRAARPTLVARGLIVLLAAWVLWQAFLLREGPGYAAVGPRVFPVVVGLGLLAGGAALLVGALRRPAPAPEPDAEPAEPTDWATLLGMAVLLAVYLALYLPLGFILATILFLVAAARVLGSRALVRDVVVAVALALATYLLFTRLLGLQLPGGPLAEVLPF